MRYRLILALLGLFNLPTVASAEITHQVRGRRLCQVLASIAVGKDAAGIAEARHDAERAIGRELGEPHEPFAAFAPVTAHKSRQECVLLRFEALSDALSQD